MNRDTCLSFSDFLVFVNDNNSLIFLGSKSTPYQYQGVDNVLSITGSIDRLYCLDSDGNVFEFEKSFSFMDPKNNLSPENIKHKKLDLPPVKSMFYGHNFVFFLTFDGLVYSYGENENCQLGLGHNEKVTKPQLVDIKNVELISCTKYGVLYFVAPDKIYISGKNPSMNLEINQVPRFFDFLHDVKDMKSNEDHTLILDFYGNVYIYGVFGETNYVVPENVLIIEKFYLLENIPKMKKISCTYSLIMCVDFDDNIWYDGSYIRNSLIGDFSPKNGESNYEKALSFKKLDLCFKVKQIYSQKNIFFALIKDFEDNIYFLGDNFSLPILYRDPNRKWSESPRLILNDPELWKNNNFRSKQKSARK